MFTQWRYIDRNYVETVVEIFTKRSIFECRPQVAIGCCYQPHIHFDGPSASKPLEFAFLQYSQKFHLRHWRHITDLVETTAASARPALVFWRELYRLDDERTAQYRRARRRYHDAVRRLIATAVTTGASLRDPAIRVSSLTQPWWSRDSAAGGGSEPPRAGGRPVRGTSPAG